MTIWFRHIPLSAAEEDALLQSDSISLPLENMPDLSMIRERSQLKHLLAALYPDAPPEKLDRLQDRVWTLVRTVDVEDIFAVPLQHKKIVALAEITEPYHYATDATDEDVHCVKVEWQDKTIPFRKFGKGASILKRNDSALEEITDVKTRNVIRSAMPYTYNRFTAIKWLIGLFILWRLYIFITQRSGMF